MPRLHVDGRSDGVDRRRSVYVRSQARLVISGNILHRPQAAGSVHAMLSECRDAWQEMRPGPNRLLGRWALAILPADDTSLHVTGG